MSQQWNVADIHRVVLDKDEISALLADESIWKFSAHTDESAAALKVFANAIINMFAKPAFTLYESGRVVMYIPKAVLPIDQLQYVLKYLGRRVPSRDELNSTVGWRVT